MSIEPVRVDLETEKNAAIRHGAEFRQCGGTVHLFSRGLQTALVA